jgi:FAD/FMN-containing dehydrogenase
VFWAGNLGEAGQFLHGYQSVWLPASLLRTDQQARLRDALFASSRHWKMSLHFNKGLAGAPVEEVAAAKDTAMNPAVLSAFALRSLRAKVLRRSRAFVATSPTWSVAREEAGAIDRAMKAMLPMVAQRGSYVSESNFFERAWQKSYWGTNYPRLRAIKKKYDPDGLFFVHHGVGSEEWSPDGFTRLGSN